MNAKATITTASAGRDMLVEFAKVRQLMLLCVARLLYKIDASVVIVLQIVLHYYSLLSMYWIIDVNLVGSLCRSANETHARAWTGGDYLCILTILQ